MIEQSIKIRLSAGADTEPLLQLVLDELGDAIDGVEVERQLAPATGLGSEPVTTSALLAAPAVMALVYAVSRAVEKIIENSRQKGARDLIRIAIEHADSEDVPEIVKEFRRLEEQNAGVVNAITNAEPKPGPPKAVQPHDS